MTALNVVVIYIRSKLHTKDIFADKNILQGMDCKYRDRRVERHSKYINHLASLMSNIVSDTCHNLNFRTQIYFGTSVREDGTEFGLIHCRFSKYHEILCN